MSTQRAEELKVPYLYHNTAKKIHAELPDTLKKGTYQLEIRTTVNNAKEVRTGVASSILTVA